MPDEPPRLFLSYGVRDASEIAERLHRDLTARHYQIWQDIRRIRIGWPWDEEVQAGLRNSQVVLALLSPQSVRRALDVGNPTATDSVCLDEIAYARGSCKIPIVPVQVVSCEAPFLVYRLHQIDFRHWRESEATYQAGLNQISAAIEAALRGETPERPWRPSLEPWDFAPFLLEKRNHFTGRKWLFRDLDEWRRKEAPPALLITGEPGIGKSAIVAALVHDNPAGQVLAYHCCRADTPATLEPARFVRSLAGMLAARIEGYAAMLENPGIKDALEHADTDSASAFEAAILSPLHTVPRASEDRRYLLIDALDEALMHPKRPTIVEVLASRINRLPAWLGIVATTRSEPSVLNQLRGLPAQALKADDPRNQDDVRAFLQRRLSEPGLRNKVEASGKMLDELATSLLRSSAGNFLFVTTAIDAVEGGQLRFDDIENQPPGRLSSLYEVFFNRLFREAGLNFQAAGRVLEVVAAAREPLTRKQIAAVIGLDAENELPPLLGRLAAFVPVREGRYSLFHHSLFEWLTGWDAQQDQSFAGPYHVSLQDGHRRLAEWGWSEYKRGIQNVSLYCLRHLVFHLHEADRNDQARAVLLNFDWLQAKLRATDVAALLADCAALPANRDIELFKGAIELSASVLDEDAIQLSGQLVGRLWKTDQTAIESLCRQIVEGSSQPWLRPRTRSLVQSGGALRRRLLKTGSVTALALTPDGRHLVTISGDVNEAKLTIWDLDRGARPRMLSWRGWPGSGFVKSIVVSADGKRAVACAESVSRGGMATEYRLAVLDLETCDFVRTLQGHTASVDVVAITMDGRRAVSACRGTLRVWDLEGGACLHVLEGFSERVNALEVTSDNRRVVSVSDDGTLRVWNLQDGTLIHTLGGRGIGPMCAVAVTSDTTLAVCGITRRNPGDPEGPYLRVWNINTGVLAHTLAGHEKPVSTVTVDADGRRAFSGSWDGTVKVWDLKTGCLLRTLSGHNGAVTAIGVSPDGRRAMTASRDNTCRIWDLETGTLVNSFSNPMWSADLVLHPLGWTHELPAFTVRMTRLGPIAVSISKDGSCRLWNVEESGAEGRDAHGSAVDAVALTLDGRYAVSTADDGTLRIWDTTSGDAVATLRGSRDDLKSGAWKELAVEASFAGVSSTMALAACSLRVVPCESDQRPQLRDLEGGCQLADFPSRPDVSDTVDGLATGRQVLCAGWNGMMSIWDLPSDRRTLEFRGHQGLVNAASVSFEEGGRLASVSDDGTLKVWDTTTGVCIATFTGDAKLTCVAALGRLFAAGSSNGAVHILELAGQGSGWSI
jgi:WD40 repeat protein